MSIKFTRAIIVGGIHSHGFLVDGGAGSSWDVRWEIGKIIRIGGPVLFSVNEVACFVHIYPDTREGDLGVKQIKPKGPVSRGVGVSEIREMDIARPDFSQEVFTIRVSNVDLFLNRLVEVGIIVDSDTSINDRDPSLLISLEHVVHLGGREVGIINDKVNIILHVVNIRPDDIKNKIVRLVVGEHSFHFLSVLEPILGLMVAKSPEWMHDPSSDIGVILLDNSLWESRVITTKEEVKIDDTTNDLVGQDLVLNDDVHSIGTSQQNH